MSTHLPPGNPVVRSQWRVDRGVGRYSRVVGGYDAVLGRTPEGWRSEPITLTIVSNTGEMIRDATDGGMIPARIAAA